MVRRIRGIALALALPLSLLAVACGEDQDRRALLDEELERELDLAFPVDTAMPTFEDTAVGEAPVEAPPPASAPAPVQPRPQPVQPRPQQPAPAPSPAPPTTRTVTSTIQAGTSLAIRMNDELSTDRSQVGDAFTATLTAPVVDAYGNVLIPAGATVRGRVTAVAPSTRVGSTASMNLAFETISYGGTSYPLDATVERADVQQRTRTSTGEQAGKVAAGAAAGAILGQVIGRDRQSTIRGAAIGAAAGTAVAIGTADVDAVLPQGAEVTIRLDRPIEVTRTVTG